MERRCHFLNLRDHDDDNNMYGDPASRELDAVRMSVAPGLVSQGIWCPKIQVNLCAPTSRTPAEGRTAIKWEDELELVSTIDLDAIAVTKAAVAGRHLEPKLRVLSRSAKFLPSCVVRIFTAGHRRSGKEKCGVNQSSHLSVAYCALGPMKWSASLLARAPIECEFHPNDTQT